jgi:hypothetical protein
MSNTENLLEGMEGIFHNGPTDISDKVANIRIEPRKANTATVKVPEVKPTGKDKPIAAQWEPIKPDPNWLDRLKGAAKWMLPWSALCLLVFYWQQADLMASAAAVPSMCFCTMMAGFGAGKYAIK